MKPKQLAYTLTPGHLAKLRRAAAIAAAATAACATPQAISTESHHPLPGTYELLVCKGSCRLADSANPMAIGRLVLSDTLIDRTPRLDSADRYLERSMRAVRDHGPNGCFLFSTRDSALRSYVGINRVGLIGWAWGPALAAGSAPTDSVIRFHLYRSADAHYVVRLRPVGSTLRGIGHSSGAGIAEVDWPDDSVIARRLGAPDVALCFEAAAVEWRRSRQQPRRELWWLPQN